MELGIEKCTGIIMKKRKRETTEGIELFNQQNIKSLGKKKL